MYDYAATVLYVVDADTLDLSVDLGFDIHMTTRIRLFGVNAAEVSTLEGRNARDEVRALLPVGTAVRLLTVKDRREKYGRYLGDVTMPDGRALTDVVLSLPGSVPYLLREVQR